MTTQLFKARDMKTANELVNDEFGEKAIILSTKRNKIRRKPQITKKLLKFTKKYRRK